MTDQSSLFIASAPRQSAEDKYQTLFENVQGAAFLTSYDGTISEANHRSYDVLGYNLNELVGQQLQTFLPPDFDWADFQDEIASRGVFSIELDGFHKNGSLLPIEFSASLFQLEKHPVMFVIIRDITIRKTAERRLKENEAKYRGLFEYATDGICVLDARGQIIEVNDKLCSLVGYNRTDFSGQNLFNMGVLTARSLPVVLQEFEQLLSNRSSKVVLSEIARKNGEIIDVEISSFFLVREDKEFDNFVILVRDVTERNASMKQQTHEHEMLRLLLDNIPDSVYFKDESNRFVLVNRAKANHSNVSPTDMIGKTDFDFMDHEEATRSFNDDTKIMQSGQAIINKTERHVLSDGTKKWTSVTKIPQFDANGDIVGTMGISRDITELQQAREELEESEARYRAVFDNQAVAIVITDEQSKIISWNSMVEELFQRIHQDLRYRAIHTMFEQHAWQEILDTESERELKNEPFETQILRGDGSSCDVEVVCKRLYDTTNQFLGTTWIFTDISKQKFAEKEMRAQHQLLMSLMDSMPDSIYFKDMQHRFVLVNKAKALHWNTLPKKMLGKTDFDYLPEEQARQSFIDDNQVLCEGKPIINKIEQISDAEGVVRWFSVTKVPRYDASGKIIGTLGLSRDVTEWLQQQPEREG